MKTGTRHIQGFGWVVALSLTAAIAVLSAGCAHEPRHAHQAAGPQVESAPASPPALPFFLIGPVSVLLTNTTDYSARLVITDDRGPATGSLFQQEGWLIFVPTRGVASPLSISFRYLWNVESNTGYVISEALRGYTKIVGTSRHQLRPNQGSNLAPVSAATGSAGEIVGVATLPSGLAQFKVWRDETGIATKIVADSPKATLELFDINPDRLDPTRFLLPSTFSPYNNTEQMVRELTRKPRVMPYSTEGTRRR